MTSFFKKLVNKPKEDEKKSGKTGKEPSSPGGTESKSPKPTGVPKRRNSTSSSVHDAVVITMNDLMKMDKLTKHEFLKPIPTFSDCAAANKAALLLYKLRICAVVLDWNEDAPPPPTPDQPRIFPKDVKRQQLLELVEYTGKTKGVMTEQALQDSFKMITSNLFRTLPPRIKPVKPQFDTEEEEPVFEASWPHMQIVYEYFLRLIVSADIDMKLLKKYLTGQFVLRLLDLFDSEDSRERDYLKTILHRIYARFMSLRPYIRSGINSVLFTFVYETEKHHGMQEILEVLGTIVSGLSTPLKPEHRSFFTKMLVPMHKVRPLHQFHQQLSYCITQFVDKDATLAIPVLNGLIKYWPTTNSAKEVLFLGEIEDVLELSHGDDFKTVMLPLARQLAKSLGSSHFQIAERALFLWHNEYVSGLFADNRNTILPVIYPALYANSQKHWNPTVLNLTQNVLKIFTDLDPALAEQCQQRLNDTQARRTADHEQHHTQWNTLVSTVKTAAP